MTTKDLLQKLLIDKTIRQAHLATMSKQLQDLDTELFSSKIGRWFGSTYLFTKRVITLLLGWGSILIALFFIFFPEIIMQHQEFKEMNFLELKALKISIRIIATLLFFIGLFILYISRLTNKMQIRNKEISKAQTLTQSIIVNFQEEIKNSELDLQIIRGIVNEDR